MTDHKHELTMLSCPECLRQAQAELAAAEKAATKWKQLMKVTRDLTVMSEQSDVARLEEIQQRWAKATPGPWGFGGNGVGTVNGIECIAVTTFPKQYDLMTDIKRTRANGEAIAAAPTDIAWLIALASRAVEAEAEMRECHMCRMTNNWHD